MENVMLQREKAMRMSARSSIIVLDQGFIRELPELYGQITPTDTGIFQKKNKIK